MQAPFDYHNLTMNENWTISPMPVRKVGTAFSWDRLQFMACSTHNPEYRPPLALSTRSFQLLYRRHVPFPDLAGPLQLVGTLHGLRSPVWAK
jgi:hypothetical protein